MAGNQLEDVKNIEVLKGPQATLGGRTAAAGIINIATRTPTDQLTGDLNVSNAVVGQPARDSNRYYGLCLQAGF